MEIVPGNLEAMEREMFQMADHVEPCLLGRFLTFTDARQVAKMLRIGAQALKIILCNFEVAELDHLMTSLEEVEGEGSD